MCLHVFTRREFLANTALAITGVSILRYVPACAQTNQEPIVISDDANDVTPSFVARALDAIHALAQRIGTSLHIMFKTVEGDFRSFFLSFEHRGAKGRIMPVVRNEQGHTLHVNHTGKGKLYTIEFLHTDGQLFERIQEHIKHIWQSIKEKTKGQDAISLGIKAATIAIGAWIGIAVAKVVLALLGFLLFYAVMIALIIAGAMAVKWLFERRMTIADRITHVKHLFIEKSRTFPELVKIISA